MRGGDRYVKIVAWSDEEHCFVGSCPELLCACQGDDPRRVFHDLCTLADDTVTLCESQGKELPVPLSGKELVHRIQGHG